MIIFHPGPTVLYCTYVNTLSVEFFIFASLLIAGRREEEVVMRESALWSMCVVIITDVLWTNLHPQPLSFQAATIAAAGAVAAQSLHLSVAFGLIASLPYTSSLAKALMVAAGLCWILVGQVGTDYVVTSNRSPAKFLILAWITVMVLGSSLSIVPWLKDMPLLLVFVAVLPRVISMISLGIASLFSSSDQQALASKAEAGTEELDALLTVAIPRAARFAAFAFTSVYGEAFNDITTDLIVRGALAAGDSTLQLAYNGAVLLSMCCGFVTEALAAGNASRLFALVWGLCQLIRCLGIQFLTPGNWSLMFAFVFFDKLTGPLGSAAMDSALLSLIRRDSGGVSPTSWIRIPANAMWTLRYPAELLQRTSCQMLLLRIGHVPWLVSISFTASSVAFVLHTLQSDNGAKQGKEA